MACNFVLRCGLVLFSLLSWCQSSALAQAPVRVLAPADAAAVSDVLDKGQQLEQQRKWADALTMYEDANKHYPGNSTLETRYDQAKMHYDLGRRYNDASFRNCLTTLNESQILDLYSEVLLKIQSHYVSNPDWQAIVSRGSRCLDMALQEPPFAERHLKNIPAERIDAFRQEVTRVFSGRQIRTRQDARDAVLAVERLAQQRLNIPNTATVMEFTAGATGSLDEYSSYLTADQLNDVYSQIEGNFVGLGLELKAVDQALAIVRVITKSPAERGGIKAGDKITAVDGKSVRELNTDQAAEMLQGREGSTVEVAILSPNGETRTIKVRREHVDVPSVDEVKIMDREAGIGYLRLTCFQKTTSRDLDNALWTLNNDGMKSLIMDLRGNPGGLLTASVEVVNKFIDDGVIVSTRGRSAQEDYNYTAHKTGIWRMPLVVLIDGDSASASEIFAGAIRDHRRGTIVGVRSYGKGSVQGIFPLSQGNAGLRLTTSKFYSPNGLPFSKIGVEPDVLVRTAAKIPVDGTAANTGPALTNPTDKTNAPSTTDDQFLAAGLQVARKQMVQK